MSKTRQRCIALIALTCSMVAIPFVTAPAMAIDLPIPGGVLPPEAEDALDEALAAVPPEVTEALDPVLAEVDPLVGEVLAQLVGLDIQYVQQVSSEPGHTTASTVEVPDTLIIGKSETTKDGARVTIVNVASEDVLTKEGTADGGEWGGTLAAAGEIVDAVHDGTCSSEDACVLLVPATATAEEPGLSYSNSASFALVDIQAGEDGITLLPNSALTNVTFGRCTDAGTALVATGSGQLAPASAAALVGPKIAIGGVLAPC